MSFNPKITYKYEVAFQDNQSVSKVDNQTKKATPPSLDKKREKPDSKYDPHSPDYDRDIAKTKTKTNCVAKFTQGVSAKNKTPSGNRVLPVAGTGLNDNAVETLNFGQAKEFKSNESFEDIASITKSEIKSDKTVDSAVIDFVEAGNKQTYALNLVNKAHDDPEQFDGVIEVFTIRDVLSHTSTETPLIAKSVKGVLSNGNIDSFGKTSMIESLVPLSGSSGTSLFLDGSERMGLILMPTAVWEKDKNVLPFDSSQNERNNSNKQSLLLSASSDMITAINALTPQTEQYPPAGFKSSQTGFIFTNGAFGVDSIAFGSLKNDA